MICLIFKTQNNLFFSVPMYGFNFIYCYCFALLNIIILQSSQWMSVPDQSCLPFFLVNLLHSFIQFTISNSSLYKPHLLYRCLSIFFLILSGSNTLFLSVIICSDSVCLYKCVHYSTPNMSHFFSVCLSFHSQFYVFQFSDTIAHE